MRVISNCSSRVLGLLLLLCGGTPGAGLAAEQPKLAVLAVGLDAAAEKEVPLLTQVANTAVSRTNRFQSVALLDALDPSSARTRPRRMEEAKQEMKLGQKEYDELDTQASLKQFERAVKLLEQTDLSQNFDLLLQAWTMKVASMAANGETRAAFAELDRLLPLAPRLQLSPNYFPPDAIAYAEKVRRSLANTQTARLEVKSSGAPAQVYIDGRFAGVTPLRRNDLTQADHYVTVLADGYIPQQQRVRSGLLEVDLKRVELFGRFSNAVDRVRLDPKGLSRDVAAQDFGRVVDSEQVLLLMLSKSTTGDRLEAVGIRINVKDGHNYSFRNATLDRGDGLHKSFELFCAGLLLSDEPRQGGPVTHAIAPSGSPKPTIGYVMIGAGAALLAGSAVFGVSALHQADLYRNTPQTDPRSDSILHTGKTYALLADVFALAGLISGGAGTYLGFFSGPKASVSVESAPSQNHPMEEHTQR